MTISAPAFRRLAFLALLAIAGPAVGQEGQGRVTGKVLDPSGEPLAGAEVSLSPVAEPESRTFRGVTRKNGRFNVLGPWPGRWEITIIADGHVRSEGWVTVVAGVPTKPIEVRLRSLDEGTPAFSEGGASTTVRWIERGNSLLAQQRYAEARAEYEKVLAVLPPSEQGEVVNAVARTHFLEGDVDAAVERLESGLIVDPVDADLRKLYEALQGELDRAEKATVFLADLDAGKLQPPDDDSASRGGRPPWLEALLAEPVTQAAAGRTGMQRVRLENRSPQSHLEIFLERSGMKSNDVLESDPSAAEYDLAAESYRLYVPPGDPPAAGYALVVWASPTPFGGFRPGMEAILDRQRTIWIGADGAGNGRPVWDRWGLALDAAANVAALYPLDPHRIWIAGYSGGGRVASALATLYPEVFRGGFSWFGVDHFHPLPVPDKPGATWPAGFPKPAGEGWRQARADSRFVLLTGSRDFNRAQTLAVAEHLERDGFAHVHLLEIPDADHYFGIDPAWMERGLTWLGDG